LSWKKASMNQRRSRALSTVSTSRRRPFCFSVQERLFALAHELGLHTWYHCCGNFDLILDDFHEIGADVINIAQPNVVDVAAVGRRWCGQQCFMLPISYQTVSISGTPEEIHAEARRLYDLLGAPAGGFIGYVEEYGVMGMSPENYRACANAFRQLCAAARLLQTPIQDMPPFWHESKNIFLALSF